LIEVETKFLFANSTSEFSRNQDPTRTLVLWGWSGVSKLTRRDRKLHVERGICARRSAGFAILKT
jgi:hypothetical protein